jgi:hypothetical protein
MFESTTLSLKGHKQLLFTTSLYLQVGPYPISIDYKLE